MLIRPYHTVVRAVQSALEPKLVLAGVEEDHEVAIDPFDSDDTRLAGRGRTGRSE